MKNFNLTLTESEVKQLLTLLEPSSDDNDPGEHLYNKLRRTLDIDVASLMHFVNVYEVRQAYGGAEEGGWYYHTYDCIACCGTVATEDDHSSLYDVLCQVLEAFEMFMPVDEATFEKNVQAGSWPEYYEVDTYGEGYMACIEIAPGLSHNTAPQYYS